MRNARKAVGLSLVVGLACALAPRALGVVGGVMAQAASATDAQKTIALEKYTAGKTAYEAGRYDDALAQFGDSYAAVASPNTKLMLARCLAQLGRNAEAYDAYAQTTTEARASGDPKYDPAAKAAEEEQATLGSRVGTLTVRLSGNSAGASVAVQGRPVPNDRIGKPIAVDPGDVEVVVTRADGTTDTRPLLVAAGRTAEVEIDASPLPAAEEAPPPMAAPADAEPEEEGGRLTDVADIGLVLGGKIGAGLGKPFSEFGASYVLEVELGYMLPVLDKGIEIFVSGQYTRPKITDIQGDPDPQLPGDGVLHSEITQDIFALTLGALYRFHVGLDWLAPYGGLGARLYMLRSNVKSSAGGESFGETEETQSDAGLLVMGGVDFRLGPGALMAELQFGWAHVDGFVLRDTNLGALQLLVGYRAML